MGWSALSLCLVLASSSSTPQVTRLNLEPILLGVAGLIGAGVGAWRLGEAEARYQDLKAIPLSAGSAAQAASLLRDARSLVFRGEAETVAGVAFIAVGAAALTGSLVWLLVEGLRTPDWLITPGPQGVAVVGRF